MEITGSIYNIGERKQVSDKLTTREFIIKTDDAQYPQFLKFELANDKCSLIDGKQVDEFVNVHFNLRGRIANNGQCYNQLQAWKIA